MVCVDFIWFQNCRIVVLDSSFETKALLCRFSWFKLDLLIVYLCVCFCGFRWQFNAFGFVQDGWRRNCQWFDVQLLRPLYYESLQREEKGKMKHKAFYFFYWHFQHINISTVVMIMCNLLKSIHQINRKPKSKRAKEEQKARTLWGWVGCAFASPQTLKLPRRKI